MNRVEALRALVFAGVVSFLLAPTSAYADAGFTVKRNPFDAKAPFGITSDFSGWLATDPIPLNADQDTTAFSGSYLSNGPDGAGTSYAWIVDPNRPGSASSQVKIRYITSHGVTTYSGLFKSHGPESTPGKTPDGPTDGGTGPVNDNPVNPIINGVLPVNPSPAVPVVQGVTPSPPDPSLVVPSTGSNLNSSISAGVITNFGGGSSSWSSGSSGSGSFINSGVSGTGGTITSGGGLSGGGSGHVVNPPAVPEPGEYAMMLIGAAMVGFRVRQKQGKAR